MKSHSLCIILALGLLTSACFQNDVDTELNTDQLVLDLKELSSDKMEGRRTGTQGNALAREYLLERFQDEGAVPFQGSYTHNFTFERRNGETMEGVNVIGKVQGSIDSVILITAHYDHLGIRDSLIFNGADDDASGTAALLAYIDYFSEVKPKHTLVFAAFDAEEMGLRGARALAEDSVFLEKLVLNINLDMISNNDVGEIYASGTYHHPELEHVLSGIDTGEIKLLFGHDRPEQGYDDWTNSSDHGAFHAKGKKFIYFGVEDHEHYHQSTDEFESIPLDFYKQSTSLILNAIIALDNM